LLLVSFQYIELVEIFSTKNSMFYWVYFDFEVRTGKQSTINTRVYRMFHTGHVKTRKDNLWHVRMTHVSTDLSQRDDGLLRPVPNRSVACCWWQHCCSYVTTVCNRPVENSIAAALSQQLVTDLLTSCCVPVRTDRCKASERIHISACWQQDLTDLLQIYSDLRVSGCVVDLQVLVGGTLHQATCIWKIKKLDQTLWRNVTCWKTKNVHLVQKSLLFIAMATNGWYIFYFIKHFPVAQWTKSSDRVLKSKVCQAKFLKD
jgi:hypothetical protein